MGNILILYNKKETLFVSMRQNRHQRMISLHKGKENQVNKSNLPLLESKCLQKISLKNEYRLGLKDNKKKYLNLCTKEQKLSNNILKDKNIESLISARLPTNHSNTPTLQTYYPTSRQQKKQKHKYNTARVWANSSHHTILAKHKITPHMRAKMIDWLMEITEAYQLKNQTFFLAIHLMDEYFRKSKQRLEVSELHVIGITCIFMACKYEEVHPLRLKTVFRDIGHSKIPCKKIIEREGQILKEINFSFSRSCPYLLCQQFLHGMSGSIKEGEMEKIRKNSIYFVKLSAFDLEAFYNTKSQQILSKSCILAAIRLNSQSYSSVQIYDNFLSSCECSYESLHNICTNLFSLNSSLLLQNSDLVNITKINPMKVNGNGRTHKMIESCAL